MNNTNNYRKRKRIGLLLEYRGGWLGGIYYILNIIKSLDYLEDEEKPELVLFYDDNSEPFLKQIKYPYQKTVKIDFQNQSKDYIKSWLSRKDFFLERLLQEKLDGLFPVNDMPVSTDHKETKVVSWFPDLQHKFHPEYFSRINLILRELRLKLLLRNGKNLVVSSEDTKRQFQKFYGIQPGFNCKVLPFVSILNDFKIPAISSIRKKYELPEKFFVVSNQFYEHKNHITVLEALNILKAQGEKVTVIFTGLMEDPRNPKFINKLKNYIDKNNLKSVAKFVGLIPRAEQLALLKNAVAVIQPSLFEGWSTLVEDAKALRLQIIVSNIDVHYEQLGNKGCFFRKNDAHDLANKILHYCSETITQHETFASYDEHIKAFGSQFISMFANGNESKHTKDIDQKRILASAKPLS